MGRSALRYWLSLAALAAALPARAVAAAPLVIESDTTCPSGPAVADALAGLYPPAEWPSGTVRIQSSPDGLIVDLIAEGATRRELRVAADCGVRATTVALVIAAWTGALASDAAGAPVLREPAPTVRPRAPSVIAAPASLPPAARTTSRELGVGLLLSYSGGFAPGVHVGFVEARAPRGLGWQVDLVLPTRRDRGSDGVTARWTRAAASIALNGRLTLRRLALSVDAGLAGAYTFTSGQGYSVDQGAQALTGGVVAGVRLALPWWRLRVFTDVRGHKWLLPQTVTVDSLGGGRVAEVALPSFDLEWSLGLAYPFR